MLRLISRNDQPEAAAPPAEPSARDRLRQHLAGIAAINERLTKLGGLAREKNTADAAVEEAQQRLAAVAKAEQKRWHQYVEAGAVGVPPQPLIAERAARAAELADAQARAAQAGRGGDVVERAHMAATHERAAALQALPPLVGDVLVEEAQEITARYETALGEALRQEARLNALADVTLVAGLLRAGEAIRGLRRNGTAGKQPLITKADLADIKQRAAAFLKSLETDAGATL